MKSTAKKDLRIDRTHKILCNALLDLLKNHTFEEIRVKDICEKAMVHRSTFYTHFEDKNHLLTYGLQDMINLITSLKTSKSDTETANEIIQKVFNHVYENHSLYELLLYKCNSNTTISIFQEQISYDFKNKLAHEAENEEKSAMNLEIASQFYAGAIISVITWWLKKGMLIPIEQISEELTVLLLGKQSYFSINNY